MTAVLNKGDKWKLHYRGTRYHFNTKQEVWWETHKDGVKIRVESGHEGLVKELLSVKPEGGSFRITEKGDCITKILSDKGEWVPIFMCEVSTTLNFENGIINTPKVIGPGDLWPGFFDGARYTHLLDRFWWNNPEGYRQYMVETLPHEVIQQLRIFKPEGGSFRITENGYVIALIPKQPLPSNIKDQWEKLSAIQQRLIATKVKSVDMLPVYIGRYHGDITLKEPIDFSRPLSKEDRKEMLDFLDGFPVQTDFEGLVPKNIDKEVLGEGEEFLDDPEDWK